VEPGDGEAGGAGVVHGAVEGVDRVRGRHCRLRGDEREQGRPEDVSLAVKLLVSVLGNASEFSRPT